MKFQEFLHALQISDRSRHQMFEMANSETQQMVKDIIMQIISDVEHTLKILDNSNELGNKIQNPLSLTLSRPKKRKSKIIKSI